MKALFEGDWTKVKFPVEMYHLDLTGCFFGRLDPLAVTKECLIWGTKRAKDSPALYSNRSIKFHTQLIPFTEIKGRTFDITDFAGADLRYILFNECQFKGYPNWSGALLEGAKFLHCTGATPDWTKVEIPPATIEFDSVLSGLNLSRMRFPITVDREDNFKDAKFNSSVPFKVPVVVPPEFTGRIEKQDFSYTKARNLVFDEAHFYRCIFDGADWKVQSWNSSVTFEQCQFLHSNILCKSASIPNVPKFQECIIIGEQYFNMVAESHRIAIPPHRGRPPEVPFDPSFFRHNLWYKTAEEALAVCPPFPTYRIAKDMAELCEIMDEFPSLEAPAEKKKEIVLAAHKKKMDAESAPYYAAAEEARNKAWAAEKKRKEDDRAAFIAGRDAFIARMTPEQQVEFHANCKRLKEERLAAVAEAKEFLRGKNYSYAPMRRYFETDEEFAARELINNRFRLLMVKVPETEEEEIEQAISRWGSDDE